MDQPEIPENGTFDQYLGIWNATNWRHKQRNELAVKLAESVTTTDEAARFPTEILANTNGAREIVYKFEIDHIDDFDTLLKIHRNYSEPSQRRELAGEKLTPMLNTAKRCIAYWSGAHCQGAVSLDTCEELVKLCATTDDFRLLNWNISTEKTQDAKLLENAMMLKWTRAVESELVSADTTQALHTLARNAPHIEDLQRKIHAKWCEVALKEVQALIGKKRNIFLLRHLIKFLRSCPYESEARVTIYGEINNLIDPFITKIQSLDRLKRLKKRIDEPSETFTKFLAQWNKLSLIEVEKATTIAQVKMAYDRGDAGAKEVAIKKMLQLARHPVDLTGVFDSDQNQPACWKSACWWRRLDLAKTSTDLNTLYAELVSYEEGYKEKLDAITQKRLDMLS